VDRVLRVETPFGPCWRRYNHDGYGQRADGGPYLGAGQGRAWPLLTGERAHYELAAGRDVKDYIRTLEAFATGTGLLPEQVWDEPDLAAHGLAFGRPTGAAMPLMWAHAEYCKLLRSVHDGRVFDLISVVAERYISSAPRRRSTLELWKFNRQVPLIEAGRTLRVQAGTPFRLRWTEDEWRTARDTASVPSGMGPEYVDLPIAAGQKAPLRFTFYWLACERWEGRDFAVAVQATPAPARETKRRERGERNADPQFGSRDEKGRSDQ